MPKLHCLQRTLAILLLITINSPEVFANSAGMSIKTEYSQEVNIWFDENPRQAQQPTRRCREHTHGSHTHSCLEPGHPPNDETHSHMGLPTYHTLRQTYRFWSFYTGLKLGTVKMDSKRGTAGGALIGLGIDDFSVEAEFNQVSAANSHSTYGMYVVRRMGDALYTKLKLGFLRDNSTSDVGEQQDNYVSGGIGFGMNRGQLKYEGEFTYLGLGEHARYISMGINYVF